MTKLVFENAAFVDAIRKANIVAPSSGAAFDKAAGIMIEIEARKVRVRSTNLDIYRSELLDPLSIEGDPVVWRLPSKVFTAAVETLPIGQGKALTLEDKVIDLRPRSVRLRSDRRNVRFNLIDPSHYPVWAEFAEDGLISVDGIGTTISKVAWAAAKAGEPLNGIHFDGEYAVATNRYKLAVTPAIIPDCGENGFTLPNSVLPQVLKRNDELRLRFDAGRRGSQLLLMPDDATQIRCITFGEQYPPSYKGLMTQTRPDSIKLYTEDLLNILGTAREYSASDRDAPITLYIGEGEIAVTSENQQIGVFGDVVLCSGQATHPRVKVNYDPGNIIEALTQSPSKEVTLNYDQTNIMRLPLHIDSGIGYQAWIAPRLHSQAQSNDT